MISPLKEPSFVPRNNVKPTFMQKVGIIERGLWKQYKTVPEMEKSTFLPGQTSRTEEIQKQSRYLDAV